MKLAQLLCLVVAAVSLSLPACYPVHAEDKGHGHEEHQHQKIVATSPLVRDVTVTQKYVCQIRSQRNIEVRAQMGGYLDEVLVKEGQAVKKGDVLFKIMPTLYKARLDAENAEANLAQIKFNNTKKLFDDKVVSIAQVMLDQAELDKANAKARLAATEVGFTDVKAPFDGIVDRIQQQQGSLIKEGKEGDVLTTLSDNSLMWVYFNVPEANYLDDVARRGGTRRGSQIELADTQIELMLANGRKFPHTADKFVTIEAVCDNETGNFKYRADFPNPEGLLRHGQTGNVLVHRTKHNALIVPQRATFPILDKQYVYVIGDDHCVHQREIDIDRELDDIFVLKGGVSVTDKIILEGVRELREGQKVEPEFVAPEKALSNLKYHAE